MGVNTVQKMKGTAVPQPKLPWYLRWIAQGEKPTDPWFLTDTRTGEVIDKLYPEKE